MLVVLLAGCAGDPGRLVFLDFSDGTHGVARGELDHAPADVSRLCTADVFAPFRAPSACGDGDLDRCREEVLAEVLERFAAYDVAFTVDRPSRGDWSTVVIAPPHPDCAFGRRGVSFEDCDDADPSSVGFAFDCYGDAASCAVLVAHEVGHGFGLVHSDDPTDLMTPAPGDPGLRFQREPSSTGVNTCGIARQSSHDALVQALGLSATRQGPPSSGSR